MTTFPSPARRLAPLVQPLKLVLLLLIYAVALGWLARHFRFPYPIALAVSGALPEMIPKTAREWGELLRAEIAEWVALATPEGMERTPRNQLLKQLRRVAIDAERSELRCLWRKNEIGDEVRRR